MEALLMQVQHEGQAFAPERVEWDTAPELDASAVASFYEKYGFREPPKPSLLFPVAPDFRQSLSAEGVCAQGGRGRSRCL